MQHHPRYPIYIPSKGRADSRLTIRALDAIGVSYRVVVEEQEYATYAAVVDPARILVLDPQYQRDYNACDALGMTKGKGAGAARNFIWDHAIDNGAAWHWTLDDNIKGFYRLNKNLKVPVSDGACFVVMEDFCARYRNVAMAGPNYFMFASRKARARPFVPNTRIYSCNLIRNDVPFRWRGRLNEDTIISLDMLKAGWCTILFNAFLQEKAVTQTLRGGNTDEFYAKDGTLEKSRMLVREHPDVARLVKRWGRWHHYVDYSGFRSNRLVRRAGVNVATGVDNYGMKLVHLGESACHAAA